MKEKIFSPESTKRGEFSLFLEAAEAEEKKKAELGSRISERIKFLETEKTNLEFLKENSKTSPEKIREVEERLDTIYAEILKLDELRQKSNEKINDYIINDETAKSMLRNFKPDIEH